MNRIFTRSFLLLFLCVVCTHVFSRNTSQSRHIIHQLTKICAGQGGSLGQSFALVNIDVQPDFLEGGPLAVQGADQKFLDHYNREQKQIRSFFKKRIMTLDWHPSNHISFAANHEDMKPYSVKKITFPSGRAYTQTLWPVHCLANTPGAASALDLREGDVLRKKGTDPRVESYSAFFDEDGSDLGLVHLLKKAGITVLLVGGVATDYCVLNNVMHAINAGFTVVVNEDWICGVDVSTSNAARERMRRVGVVFTNSRELGLR